MKIKRQNWIVFALLVFVLVFLGGEILGEYLAKHQYYFGKGDAIGKFENMKNRGIVIRGLLYSLIPLVYLWFTKKVKGLWVGITLFVSLFLFGLTHIGHKGTLMGGSGTMMFAINMLLFQGLATFFIMFVYGLGNTINDRLFRLKQASWTNIMLTWGLGLGVHLIINHILILLGLYHPIILWLYFLGGAGLVRWKRGSFSEVGSLFQGALDSWKSLGWTKYVLLTLLMMSLLYLMFGLQLSFIPYPTAWDANHAYMLFPKIFALNNGYIWSGGPSPAPYLWLSYIAFWFGLFSPFGDGFWLAPDTIAVIMNFMSGIFVLVFGVVAVKELLSISSLKDDKKLTADESSLFLGLGRFGLLLWLTSGMGAFLVFVDNKTDLGVLSLVILAMLSGFRMMKSLSTPALDELDASNSKVETPTATPSSRFMRHKYILISGLFFGMAVLAKPTAFVDVFTFVLYFVGLFVGIVAVLALILIGLGAVTKLGILNTKNMIHESSSIWLLGLGVLGTVPEFAYSWIKKVRKYMLSFFLWLLAIVVTVVVVKSPHVLYKYFQADQTWSSSDLLKRYLMGSSQEPHSDVFTLNNGRKVEFTSLVAATVDIDVLDIDDDTEEIALSGETLVIEEETIAPVIDNPYLPLSQCSLLSVGAENVDDLYDRMKIVKGGGLSEDVGRYVGFGQKKFSGGGVGNSLLRLIYPQSGHCYTRNKLAYKLCRDRDDISTYTQSTLDGLLSKKYASSSNDFINELLEGIEAETVFASDITSALNSYWKNRTVLRQDGGIFVPYRYLIPFNVVQNWSLQNESSYYTDIGFIWLISLCLLIVGLLYSLLVRDRKVLAISLASIGGWVLWIVIGGGIVWYGLGLIVWLVLANLIFLYRLTYSFDKSSIGRKISYGCIVLFAVRGLFQRGLNMTRIATQGGGGPFINYKQGVSTSNPIEIVNGGISQAPIRNNGFGWKDVFALQFAHYNPFLDAVKDRKSNEGVYIAGTYAEYFLKSHRNVLYDGLVNKLWKRMSDEDVCASYLRLKDKNMKFIVIDPNIATVVMGQGNSSLFHRFLAKTDANGKRLSNGVMAQLAEMVMAGYMELIQSTNLGITYAYTLDSSKIASLMSQVGETDEVLFRTKLSSARFFRADAGKYQNLIANLLIERLQSGEAVQDLADIFGKLIDSTNVRSVIAMQAQGSPQFVPSFEELSQDERFIVTQYLNLMGLSRNNKAEFQIQIERLLRQSLSSGSQIGVWQLVD